MEYNKVCTMQYICLMYTYVIGIKSKRKLYCIFICIYYEILVLKKNNFFSKLILFNKIYLNFGYVFMKVYVEYLSSLRRGTETPLLITCSRLFIFTDKTRAGWRVTLTTTACLTTLADTIPMEISFAN